MGAATRSAVTLPGDVATGKVDMNDPSQAGSNASRVLGAALLASPAYLAGLAARGWGPGNDPLSQARAQSIALSREPALVIVSPFHYLVVAHAQGRQSGLPLVIARWHDLADEREPVG